MKITRIGFGAIKNTGNYENIKVYFEAELESDEYIDTYMDALRELVAVELNLGDQFSNVRSEIRDKKRELADLVASIDLANIQLESATNKWQNLLDYFAVSHPALGSIVTGVKIVPQINFDEIDEPGESEEQFDNSFFYPNSILPLRGGDDDDEYVADGDF